jgi:hypothetical protein
MGVEEEVVVVLLERTVSLEDQEDLVEDLLLFMLDKL